MKKRDNVHLWRMWVFIPLVMLQPVYVYADNKISLLGFCEENWVHGDIEDAGEHTRNYAAGLMAWQEKFWGRKMS